MLVDSHCHLDFDDFAENRDEIVAAARRAGVERMVTICTRLDRYAKNRAIVDRYDDVFMGVGVHPLEAGAAGLTDPDPLRSLLAEPKVVAVGETGLDYHYQRETRAAQIKNFEVHIELARETGLPLIVHTRDADDDTVAILRAGHAAGAFPCVIHCFTASDALADACLDMGHSLSFSGIVTFKSATAIQSVAQRVPADRYLVETDSPYLAPVPKRGKRNEPAYVAHTAQFVAGLRGITLEQLHQETGETFLRLFNRVPRTLARRAA